MELKIIALFTSFIITGAALTLLNRLVELTKYLPLYDQQPLQKRFITLLNKHYINRVALSQGNMA